MSDFIIMMVVAGVVMAAIDAVWLRVVANSFYKSQIGKLLLDKPNLSAAAIFYVIYIIGVVAFVIMPAIAADSWQYALGYGSLFGLVAYATYDLTNLATLKGFTNKLVIVDLIWGSVLTAVVSVISYSVLIRVL